MLKTVRVRVAVKRSRVVLEHRDVTCDRVDGLPINTEVSIGVSRFVSRLLGLLPKFRLRKDSAGTRHGFSDRPVQVSSDTWILSRIVGPVYRASPRHSYGRIGRAQLSPHIRIENRLRIVTFV